MGNNNSEYVKRHMFLQPRCAPELSYLSLSSYCQHCSFGGNFQLLWPVRPALLFFLTTLYAHSLSAGFGGNVLTTSARVLFPAAAPACAALAPFALTLAASALRLVTYSAAKRRPSSVELYS